MAFRPNDIDMPNSQVNILDSKCPCLTGSQATTIKQSEEHRKNEMPRVHCTMWLELVTGEKKRGNLLRSKEMWYVTRKHSIIP